MNEIGLPPPAATLHTEGPDADHIELYAPKQMRECILEAVRAERQANLDAVAALAATSRDREERDVIAACWNAIKRRGND